MTEINGRMNFLGEKYCWSLLSGFNITEKELDSLKRYLQTVYENSLYYNNVFFDEKIHLTKTYIPVQLKNLSLKDDNYISSKDFIEQVFNKKTFVFGKMGCGKSTLMHYLILLKLEEIKQIPIFIKFRYNEEINSIKEYLKFVLENDGFSDLVEIFTQLYTQQKLYFIFDSIDTCHSGVLTSIINEINTIQSPFILTSTLNNTDQTFQNLILDFEMFEIQDIKIDDAIQLIKNYDKVFNSNCLDWLKNVIRDYTEIVSPLFNNPFMVSCIYRLSILGNKLKDTELDLMKNDPRLHPLQNMNINLGKLRNRVFQVPIKIQDNHKIISNYKDFAFTKKLMKSSGRDLIIEPFSGGLGDHLLYSHLPRIAKESGKYDRVLISQNSPCRSEEAKYLIWELNPYVDGYCFEESNSFYIEDIENSKRNPISQGKKAAVMFEAINNSVEDCNVLDNLMLKLGIDDNIRKHEPEIYYKPKQIEFLQGCNVYDPYYVSNPRIELHNQWLVEEFFKTNSIKLNYQMKFNNDNGYNFQKIMVRNFSNYLTTLSLRDFCDVLFSALHLYCLTTGTASLSAALNKKAIVLIGKEKLVWHHSTINQYVHIVEPK
ncbi:MAG: hypothetical protein A2X13_06060 [Bacteroidetes bacterium GWC2_33_15]|nr:MAG: hypothetical protein A2X10_03700 [Bacteroidetes bacterium GWA2_33_15]OFX51788.1 MAG: hypothetical protein A2X13_06060 [Bacteroidetes bacterium GWC2_33_15]OFX66840.1 MAG: hypothetical protein A2X15_09065 [Bacteroidetes bacterium GWB2_32_14]OFX67098.1 MAG: hypothetical protein A2X14_10570 [Bacteroidetes bacterium GWD2_33_33]HAN17189.1 hypothetical protein [Bacteroidales bacterium]